MTDWPTSRQTHWPTNPPTNWAINLPRRMRAHLKQLTYWKNSIMRSNENNFSRQRNPSIIRRHRFCDNIDQVMKYKASTTRINSDTLILNRNKRREMKAFRRQFLSILYYIISPCLQRDEAPSIVSNS
jgi:hypothetical protein